MSKKWMLRNIKLKTDPISSPHEPNINQNIISDNMSRLNVLRVLEQILYVTTPKKNLNKQYLFCTSHGSMAGKH